jgi:hypothetical protein
LCRIFCKTSQHFSSKIRKHRGQKCGGFLNFKCSRNVCSARFWSTIFILCYVSWNF